MTEARVEHEPPDPAQARVFIKRAHDFVGDAERASSSASRQVLAWQVCTTAMDAILMAAGLRVTGSDGGHVLRVQEVERVLPDDRADLFERLNDHRELRHSVSYHAGVVSEAEAEITLSDARELLTAAEAYLAPDE